jgi:hypothetical protein
MTDATTVSDGASSSLQCDAEPVDPGVCDARTPGSTNASTTVTDTTADDAAADAVAEPSSASEHSATSEANASTTSTAHHNGVISSADSAAANEGEQAADVAQAVPSGPSQAEAAPVRVPAHTEEDDEDSFSDEPDESSFPTARRTTRDSIHIHRNHLGVPAAHALGKASSASASSAAAAAAANAAMAAKTTSSVAANASGDGGGGGGGDAGGDDCVVERTSLADVVEALVPSALSKRPAPPALPNEVQFEVTYFTASLGLRLK